MLINVIDYLGNHIGVIVGKYEGDLLLALTDKPYDEIIDMESLTEEIAEYVGAANYGSVNEDLLEEKIMAWLEEEGIEVSEENLESALKMYMASNSRVTDDLDIYNKIRAPQYILLSEENLEDGDEEDDTIVLPFSAGELKGLQQEEQELPDLPYPFILGEITDDPMICFNNNCLINTVSSNNSSQQTQITFVSGDVEVVTSYPGIIKAQKGDKIAVMLGDSPEEVKGVYVEGKTYLF